MSDGKVVEDRIRCKFCAITHVTNTGINKSLSDQSVISIHRIQIVQMYVRTDAVDESVSGECLFASS